MKTYEYKLKIGDNPEIQIYEWLPDKAENIKAVFQIAHGMSEHAGRYSNFAEFLTSKNFAVYANDHRGHGKTAGDIKNIGYFAPKNGWSLVTHDLKNIYRHVKDKYPGKPHYILGHSMGSFLVRTLILESDLKLDGVILSGTGGNPGLVGKMGKLITKFLMLFYPDNSPSVLMDKLSFDKFNNAFKPIRTPFDWLSRDTALVDIYVDDPYSGIVFSLSFFKDLLTGVLLVNKQKNMDKVAEDLSLLLIAGDKDPVGNQGKGVIEVYNKFKKAGIKNITLKLFGGARHEILNETNRQEVYEFIYEWLKKN